MDQTSADPTGLSLAGDKNTGDIVLLQSNKTLYAGALFIDCLLYTSGNTLLSMALMFLLEDLGYWPSTAIAYVAGAVMS